MWLEQCKAERRVWRGRGKFAYRLVVGDGAKPREVMSLTCSILFVMPAPRWVAGELFIDIDAVAAL